MPNDLKVRFGRVKKPVVGPLALGYPKLGAFYPSTASGDIAATAKYSWVVLTESTGVTALKAANPNIMVIAGYRSAQERWVPSWGSFGLPASWILTQVGSTLSVDASAGATTLGVTETTKSGLTLFQNAGYTQYVLVGGSELCKLVTVNASSLVVERGTAYSAVPHSAGVRVAQCVTIYDQAITLDMTDNCPLGDAGYGSERWSDWVARDCLSMLDTWNDGIYVDLVEAGFSNHVGGPTSLNSIDYPRDNSVPASYTAFQAAWNAGMTHYEQLVHAGIGEKLYLSNCYGSVSPIVPAPYYVPNYALKNGTLFEEYPAMAWRDWPSTVLGKLGSTDGGHFYGSVKEWVDGCLAPSITALHNPLTISGEAGYTTARYYLTSALMAGAYHSLWPSVWLDEYDNAGAATGYLGQPTGAAAQIGATGAYRRDFDNGIALCNPTGSTVSGIALGATFQHIGGTQSAVNDGSSVSTVNLPSKDGLIMLRVS